LSLRDHASRSWQSIFGYFCGLLRRPKVSSQSDISPRNCCKIARIDRISSLFNDDGDSRLWM
ncbi:hypothetical protein, partial [Rickettsia endosymbiont of Culicoides newsteadi]|uniref:hypothetical protein n=1 Tax=Rickettsia endosymbiont of Culicoides newsteadi TaxID=1961830 RepID=UPI001958CC65